MPADEGPGRGQYQPDAPARATRAFDGTLAGASGWQHLAVLLRNTKACASGPGPQQAAPDAAAMHASKNREINRIFFF
jgi:hypothetical protein